MSKFASVGPESSVGLIQVLYGSPRGIASASQQWSKVDFSGETGPTETFGLAMTTGDFNGDHFTDLAVSDAPYLSGLSGPGEVFVIYGSRLGLTAERTQLWSQEILGVSRQAGTNDGFGAAIASGNLGYGSEDDLTIGIPGADGVGKVQVLFGSPRGLTATHSRRWGQGMDGLPGRPQRGDSFGAAITIGDFNRDRRAELVISAPGDRDGAKQVGSVMVMIGTSRGPISDDAQMWRPGRKGIGGEAVEYSAFGASLAVGRFSGSGSLDLVVGAPGLNLFNTGGAGAVTVIYGSPNGLRAAGNQQWNEYRLGARTADDDEPEDSPGFGRTLAVGEFGHGPADDLVIGAPGASTTRFEAGAIQVLYGTSDGLTANDTQRLHQRLPGVAGRNSGQHFGEALAVLEPSADDDASGNHPLLAIGEPGYRSHGMVLVLRSSDEGLLLTGDRTIEPRDLAQQPAGTGFGRRLAGG